MYYIHAFGYVAFILAKQRCFKVAFQTERVSPTFWDKETEVPSLSWDRGTTGHAQNLAKGRDRTGQPVKTQDRMWDGTVQDFDRLFHPVSWDKTGQSRKGCSKTGKGHSKNRKGHSKTAFFLFLGNLNS